MQGLLLKIIKYFKMTDRSRALNQAWDSSQREVLKLCGHHRSQDNGHEAVHVKSVTVSFNNFATFNISPSAFDDQHSMFTFLKKINISPFNNSLL